MLKESQTICVVDDEPSVCKALRRLLMSAGLDVITYNSVQDFLNDSIEVEPDLLILDVHMPVMSGLDLQKHLIATGRLIPILFISANGSVRTKNTALEAGAVAFFEKPVDEKDLLDAIHKAITPLKKSRQKHIVKGVSDGGLHRLNSNHFLYTTHAIINNKKKRFDLLTVEPTTQLLWS